MIFAEKNQELKRVLKELQLSEKRITSLEQEVQQRSNTIKLLESEREKHSDWHSGGAFGEILKPDVSPANTISDALQAAVRLTSPAPEDDDEVQYYDQLGDTTAVKLGDTTAVSPSRDAERQSTSATQEHELLNAERQAVQAEKAALVEERAELEHVRAQLESEAERVRHEQQRSEAASDRRLVQLEEDIELKQQLITELLRSEEELQKVRLEYESRIKAMEAKVERVQREADSRTVGQTNAEDRRRIKESYEAKLLDARNELETQKQQQRELLKSLKSKNASEERVKNLESEVRRMKDEHEMVRKKQRDEKRKYDDERAAKEKESLLAIHEAERKIKELETDNQRQRVDLRKKADQLAAVQRKLSSAERPNSAAMLEKKLAAIEKELEDYVTQKEATELLQRELEQRERIVKEKEEAMSAMSQLEIKKLRASTDSAPTVSRLKATVSSLEAELAAKCHSNADELETIRLARDEAGRKLLHAQQASSTKPIWSTQHEVLFGQLHDKLEALECELDFKNMAIADLQQSVSHGALLPSPKDMEELSVNQLRTLALRYMEIAVGSKKAVLKKDEQVRQLELRCEGLGLQVEEAANSMRLHVDDNERRMLKQHKDYEHQIQSLLRQIQNPSAGQTALDGSGPRGVVIDKQLHFKDEQLAMLDKDNYYYRQSNKELKRKLRDVITHSESEHALVLQLQSEVARKTELSDSLKDELENLKHFMQKQVCSTTSLLDVQTNMYLLFFGIVNCTVLYPLLSWCRATSCLCGSR